MSLRSKVGHRRPSRYLTSDFGNSMALYVGIDIGTSSTKSLLMNQRGEILAEASAGYSVQTPKPLWSEQDPQLWWQATLKTLRSVVKQSKAKPSDVKAIGLSGQMHGSVFLDQRGAVLRPALLWNDQRTESQCREITRLAGGRKQLIDWVANPALTGFTAPKLLWLREHQPRLYDRLRHLLLPKDEIRRRLTGQLATDVSDASGMLLLDVVRRRWSAELLSRLEIDPSILAPVYESTEVTGTLLPEVARQVGLTAECKVIAGAGDCAAGAIGNGVVQPGAVTVSLGTSGVVFAHSQHPLYDEQGRLHTFCHAVPGQWHVMGVTLSAAGSLQWLVEQLCPELVRRRGIDPYDVINQEAAAVSAGSEGLFFLPYLSGERTPHADPNARGCFVGLTTKHHRGHLARAVMEGVAMSLAESLTIIRQLNVPIEQIRLSGGGAKSPLWRRILTDVFGQPTCTIQAEQGPAYGVALLAAVGDGAYDSVEQACRATVKVNRQLAVGKRAEQTYAAALPRYQSLYNSLKDEFAAISQLP
jgi:xylulokinase